MVIEMIKGAAKRLLGAMAVGVSLIGCYSSEPLAGNYPPLTPEIKQSLEERTLEIMEKGYCIGKEARNAAGSNDCARIGFDGTPKEFINYFIAFTQEDYNAGGIGMRDIHGAGISIRSPDGIESVCGGMAAACEYSGILFMPDNWRFDFFFSNCFHEYGHYLSPGGNEFGSIANESYSVIKAYQFSKAVGSLLVGSAIMPPKYEEMYGDYAYIKQYEGGALFSPLNLNNNGGSIELAMDFVAHSPLLDIETALQIGLRGFAGRSHSYAYMSHTERLLDSAGFREYLVSSSGHLSGHDADELISYLKVINYRAFLDFSRTESPETASKEMAEIERFIGNPGFTNPYFRAVIARLFSGIKYDDAGWQLQNGNNAGAFGAAKSAIDATAPYPCREGNAYECPLFARQSNIGDIDAYCIMMLAAERGSSKEKDEAISYAVDFINRFYPGTDLESYDFSAITKAADKLPDNTLPFIMLYAGKMAHNLGNKGLAEQLFKAGLAAGCNGLPSIITAAACESMKNDLRSRIGQ